MPVTEAAALTPPLKWAGGKRWQVPHLRPLWEPHRDKRLVEPFAGGLAVTLGLLPDARRSQRRESASHQLLQLAAEGPEDRPQDGERRAAVLPAPRRGSTRSWRRARRTRAEAAALFYYLNRTGFNGLCRFNATGEFNVPFGRYKRIGYTARFLRVSGSVFATGSSRCGDFEDVRLERDDFVYADPPYDVEFTAYSKGGFSWDDQVRDRRMALARTTGPVVLVNQATPRIEKLYRKLGFEVRFLDAPRRISCTGDRTPAQEILGTRNL